METDFFVGRVPEMSHLMSAVEDARAGHGKVVLIAGEPGIGKTWLADRAATSASEQGFRVLRGYCNDDSGTPPHWPWTQVLRSLAPDLNIHPEAAALPAELTKNPDLIFSGLHSEASFLQEEPDVRRFRLFDQVATFVKESSSRHPLLLLFEDVHWADRSSLKMLEFVGREVSEIPVIVIATYRDIALSPGHPLLGTLAELSRMSQSIRLALRGLSLPETSSLIEQIAGPQWPKDIMENVASQTHGNPFFITAIAKEFTNSENNSSTPNTLIETLSGPPTIRLPDSVREVIWARLSRLSPGCNDILQLAAVIGTEFGLGLLEQLRETSLDHELAELMNESTIEGITEDTADPDIHRFRHALVRKALAEELSNTSRVKLHARIAQTLEKKYRDGAGSHVAIMAHHFSEAESVLGSEKTAEYAVLAGEQALQSNAFEEAEHFFRRAVNSSRNRPADQLTARMFGGLGNILTNSQLPSVRQEGWDLLSSAFDLFLRFEAIDRAVAVAETPVAMVGLRGTVDLTRRALTLLEKGSLHYGYLLARHAVALKGENGDLENVNSCLEESLNIARRHEDKRLEARVMLHYGQYFGTLRDYESTITYCHRAIALAKESGDEGVEVRACRLSADAYLSIFDFDNALLAQGRNLELAKRLHVPTTLSYAGEIEFDTARYTGDWARAIEIADCELGRTGNEELHRHRTNLIEHYLTEASDEQVRADVRVTESPEIHSEILVLAVASWLAARDTAYLDHLTSFAPEFNSSNAESQLLMLVAHGIWSITNNNVEYARDAYEKLSHLARQWETQGGVAIDHILGLLAEVVGREEAEMHFNTAANLCGQAGYRPEFAINSCDHAELLIKRGNHGDLMKARTLLADAMDIATDKGMEPLKKRVGSLTESINTAHPKYPDGLSGREAEILRLVAYGLSNQQVAERLFLSRHTVIRHVANIYAKINASNRVQATKYAHEHESDLIPHTDASG